MAKGSCRFVMTSLKNQKSRAAFLRNEVLILKASCGSLLGVAIFDTRGIDRNDTWYYCCATQRNSDEPAASRLAGEIGTHCRGQIKYTGIVGAGCTPARA